MANSSEHFAWHIAQALFHTNSAINTALGNHEVGLSQAEQTALAEIQKTLEYLSNRS